jgi:hypothetical protein
MFGWTGFKYRTEVIVNVHSILSFVPELKRHMKIHWVTQAASVALYC